MSELVFLIILGLVLWFWFDSLQVRERAKSTCARACRESGVQLLDDTVALERIWFRRGREGRLRLERLYAFEFTDNGMMRRSGVVLMLARRVEVLSMDGGDLFVP